MKNNRHWFDLIRENLNRTLTHTARSACSLVVLGSLLVTSAMLPEASVPAASINLSSAPRVSANLTQETVARLLALPEDKIDLAGASFELGNAYDQKVDVQALLMEIDQMARKLRPMIAKETDPRKKMKIMANYLFETKGFSLPRSKAEEGEHRLLHQLLQTRQGVCFPLTLLYVSLGDRLGLPLFVVDAPEHSFVRYKEGDTFFDIETTEKGMVYTREAFKHKFGQVVGEFYLKPLSRREALGIVFAQQSVFLFEQKRVQDALSCDEAALVIVPTWATAWFNKGILLQRSLQKYDKALECFDEATKLDPHYAEAWGCKGTALAQLGQYQQALESCNQALAIKSDLPENWMDKGFILAKLERPGEAIACYDKALELRSNFPQAWFMKGLAQLALRQPSEALSCFDNSIKIDPSRVFTWHYKAATLLDMGKAQDALACIETAISLNPKFAPAWETKAKIHLRLGQYSEAWKCIKTAERLGFAVSPQFRDELRKQMPEPNCS